MDGQQQVRGAASWVWPVSPGLPPLPAQTLASHIRPAPLGAWVLPAATGVPARVARPIESVRVLQG